MYTAHKKEFSNLSYCDKIKEVYPAAGFILFAHKGVSLMIYNENLLLYFRTIAEERSISRAADKLYISQSSLSKFLKALEEDVGTKLVDRHTIPISITAAGEVFLKYLEDSALLHRECMIKLSQMETEGPSELSIGASSMNSRMVSDAFPAFYSTYPYIQLKLIEGHSENLLRMLARGKIDMAVLVRNGNDANDTSASFEPLVTQHRLIVVSKKNGLSHFASPENSVTAPDYLEISALRNQKLIAGKPGQRIYEDVNELVRKHHIPIRGFLETQSIDTMISFAAKNYGITFIPPYYLHRFSALDEFSFFYSDCPELLWSLTLEFKSAAPCLAERHFASVLKEVCRRYEKESPRAAATLLR